jgi:hypothetical protein
MRTHHSHRCAREYRTNRILYLADRGYCWVWVCPFYILLHHVSYLTPHSALRDTRTLTPTARCQCMCSLLHLFDCICIGDWRDESLESPSSFSPSQQHASPQPQVVCGVLQRLVVRTTADRATVRDASSGFCAASWTSLCRTAGKGKAPAAMVREDKRVALELERI